MAKVLKVSRTRVLTPPGSPAFIKTSSLSDRDSGDAYVAIAEAVQAGGCTPSILSRRRDYTVALTSRNPRTMEASSSASVVNAAVGQAAGGHRVPFPMAGQWTGWCSC